MDLDFVEVGSRDCPLIRIYGKDQDDYRQLVRAIAAIAAGTVKRVPVQALPGFRADPSFELTLTAAAMDQGVSRLEQSQHFVWMLTSAKWHVVEGLARPLGDCDSTSAHQWLAGPEARYGLDVGPISVLLSRDGRW